MPATIGIPRMSDMKRPPPLGWLHPGTARPGKAMMFDVYLTIVPFADHQALGCESGGRSIFIEPRGNLRLPSTDRRDDPPFVLNLSSLTTISSYRQKPVDPHTECSGAHDQPPSVYGTHVEGMILLSSTPDQT